MRRPWSVQSVDIHTIAATLFYSILAFVVYPSVVHACETDHAADQRQRPILGTKAALSRRASPNAHVVSINSVSSFAQ